MSDCTHKGGWHTLECPLGRGPELTVPMSRTAAETPKPWEHPGHKPVQHRDRKPPWCNECGWTSPVPAEPAVHYGKEVAHSLTRIRERVLPRLDEAHQQTADDQVAEAIVDAMWAIRILLAYIEQGET